MITKSEIHQLVKEVTNNYFREAKLAPQQGKKVAWCTGISPTEFLQTMDFVTIFPENHAALAGARKVGLQLAEASEEMGYSNDLCSYARIDFGNIALGEGPVGHLPRPDLLLCCNDTCVTVIKWYENLARHFNVPLVLIDIPFVHENDVKQISIRYIKEQFKELIQVIEKVSGKSFDYDRFIQVVDNTSKTSKLWSEILAMTNRSPIPLTAFEAFNYMTPIVTMRGTEETLEFYQKLKAMLTELKMDATDYQYRILWDGIPLWFQLKKVSEFLESRAMAVVCSTYTHAWILPMDPHDPLESIAKSLSDVLLNRSLDFRKEMLVGLVEQFNIDGIIHHSNRSCKPAAFGLYRIAKELIEENGIHNIIIDGDQCDSRNFSMAQFETRIGAFVETMARN